MNNLFKNKITNNNSMEINYNTIVQYLCSDNEKNQDRFSTVKNIMVSVDNFKFLKLLKDLSKKTFYRYGVTKYNNEQINVSFMTSFLTLIEKNFITMDKTEELTFIASFLQSIKEKILKKFNFEISKFQKPVLLDRLSELQFNDGVLIQVISQILGLNFLIFDHKEEKINCIFSGDYMDPWKVTVFLAKYENDWEPLFCERKLFSYNDNFLKKILINEEINYFNNDYLGKEYSLMDNINELKNSNIEDFSNDENSDSSEDNNHIHKLSEALSESETISDTIVSKEEEEINDTFINPTEEIKKMNLNKTKLRNLKKDKIYDIIQKLNLDLDITEGSTKKLMIAGLIPYI